MKEKVRHNDGGVRHRRSAQELDELAFQVISLSLKEALSAKEILYRMNRHQEMIRDEREVQWLASRARQRSLAAIEVERQGGNQSNALLDPELGRRLSSVSGVRDVTIVKSSLASDESYLFDLTAPQRGEAFTESDQLHRLLGQAAARYFWDRLRQNDKIALGGGRAIGFMVDALEKISQTEPKHYGNIAVESLVGSMIIWPWSEKQANLDSDAVAVRLASILGVPQNKVSLVHLPVALGSGREVINLVAPHIAEGPYDVVPDMVFFGMGVLNSGHNLLQDTSPQSHSIREEIEELRTRILPFAPTVIAEICNRYFWIGDDDTPPQVRTAVEKILKKLNTKTIAVPLDKLNKIKEKVLVAGGAQKYRGLYSVLKESREFELELTGLITDEVSARRLITELEGDS